MSAEVHDVNARAYEAMAHDALDHLDARGWCELWGAPNVPALRSAVRAEARRRKVRVSTGVMGRERDGVYVEAREPSERAQAHRARGEREAANAMQRAFGKPNTAPPPHPDHSRGAGTLGFEDYRR
jgi:hypothetical protein